ncbi:MAG: hypothetical protein VKJ24_18105 [Synechococcales bacterium]|nr:hypothetical protein [Synechococcales bacterium]
MARHQAILSLLTYSGPLLLLTGAAILPTVTIAPTAVQAYPMRLDVGIDRLPEENYESFLRRAELVARTAVQRSFDRDILGSQVVIYILGRNFGAEVPVLSVEVRREDWRAHPDIKRWATYYRTSQGLLGFQFSNLDPLRPSLTPALQMPAPVVTPKPVIAPPAQPATPTPPTQVAPEDQSDTRK